MGVGVAEALGDFANAEGGFLQEDDGVREALAHEPFLGGETMGAVKDPGEIIGAEAGGPGQFVGAKEAIGGGGLEQMLDGGLLDSGQGAGLGLAVGAEEEDGEVHEPGAEGFGTPFFLLCDFAEQGVHGFGQGGVVGEEVVGLPGGEARFLSLGDGKAEAPDEGGLFGMKAETCAWCDPAAGAAWAEEVVVGDFGPGGFLGEEVEEVFVESEGAGVPLGRRMEADGDATDLHLDAGFRRGKFA